MGAAALLADLRASGLDVSLIRRDGRCEAFTVLVSPRRLLSDEHRLLIAHHKDGLIDLLYAEHCDQVFPIWWSS